MRSAAVTAVLIALIAGACGGSGSSSSTTASTTTTTTTLPGRPATTTPGQETTTTSRVPDTTTTTVTIDFDALRNRIDELIEITEDLRGLEFLEPVEVDLLANADYQARVIEFLNEEIDPAELAAEGAALELLGIIGPGVDLLSLIEPLYTESTGGFYVPSTGELVVRVVGNEFGPYAESVVVHELTHALQDQHFDLLDSRENLDGDADYVAVAMSEGDATFREALFVETLSIQDRSRYLNELNQLLSQQTTLDSLPPYLVQGLQAPYTDGFFFFRDLGLDDERINEALTTPPESSEQVLDATRYLIDEQPLSVQPIPQLDLSGYELLRQTTMGQKDTELLLSQFLGSREAERASEGWGGDTVAIYTSGREAAIIVIHYRGDTNTDGAEFENAWDAYLEAATPAGAFRHVDRQGDFVRVVVATDGNLASELTAALGL